MQSAGSNKDTKAVNRKYYFLLAAILVVAAVVFSNTLKNGFVEGWDDEGQVTHNEDIRSLKSENIKKVFSSYYVGMYQPVTTLSYALDYKISGPDSTTFHRTGFLLHLINIVLVFIFIRKLSTSDGVAVFVAAFFAVHPLNVESVAWISARSNLIYTLFYLLSLIFYVRFLQTKKTTLFLTVFLLFILSLLSKATAVTLPAVLLLLDLYINNKITKRDILQKIPMFVFSVIFIVIAFRARQEFSHISEISNVFGATDRVVLLLFSVSYYIFSMLFPVGLSPIHYYPLKNGSADLGFVYYAGALATLIIAGIIIWLIIRAIRQKQFGNHLLFGILFFVITISVVIHFVPIGVQLVAERYVYLPYTGLFFIAGTYVFNLRKKYFTPAIALSVLAFGFFSFVSHTQNKVWKNTSSLMSSVIEKHPEASHAYLVRADGFYLTGKYSKAIADYNICIAKSPADYSAHINRANTYAALKNYGAAIADLDIALKINNKQPVAYFNRGLAKFNTADYKNAVIDFDNALKLKPDYALAFLYRGIAYGILGNMKKSVTDLQKAVELSPGNQKAWFSLGVAYTKTKKYNDAVNAYSKAIVLNGNDSNAWLQRGIAFLMLNKRQESCNDFKHALQLGNARAKNFLMNYCK